MSATGRVEIDFEYTPESVAHGSDRIASVARDLGVLLELAAHAVSTALPGFGIADLRFGTTLRMQGPRHCRATVDLASRRLVISSAPLGAPAVREVTHLSGRAERLDASHWRASLRALLDRPEASTGGVPEHGLAAAAGVEAPLLAAASRIALYSHGAAADLVLPDESWSAYRVHPLVIECAWSLVRLWFEQRWPSDGGLAALRGGAMSDGGLAPALRGGAMSDGGLAPALRGGAMSIALRPVSAAAFHVLEPGARVDRLRLVALPTPSGDASIGGLAPALRGGAMSVVLVAERAHEPTCFVHALTVAPMPEAEAIDAAAGRLGPRNRGELAWELGSCPAHDRKAVCERYVSRVVAAALGRPGGPDAADLPRDVPFRDLGLQSLQATAIAAALADALARPLAATLLFDHPTLEQLTGATLEAALVRAQASPPVRPRQTSPRAAIAEPIAVIGMGCRLPGGVRDCDDYWRVLSDGVDAVGPVPASRVELVHEFAGSRHTLGALDRIEHFDARFFGIPSREAVAMDPQQRILLEVTWQALEDAGLVPATLAGSRTGVFIGISTSEYGALVREIDAYSVVGNAQSVASGRLSYYFGWRGPNLCIDTACSSSLVAVGLAAESLQREESDLVVAGGINLTLDPRATEGLAAAGVLSPTGRCRTFDEAADGYVRGEGCGIVVLRRLDDALARGERVLAVIRGHAINHGGRGNGLAAPNKSAQVELIQRALERAGVRASDVGYVEAHGTGTIIGDAVEVEALAETYGVGSGRDDRVWVGSAKTNLGHLESAAGIAGLIKTVLVLRHGRIPRHLNVRKLARGFDWEQAKMAVPLDTRPLGVGGIAPALRGGAMSANHERPLAAVNSFGMSGTNAHVLLAAHPAEDSDTPRPVRTGPCALVISGRSDESVRALAGQYALRLERGADPFDLARTAGQHRQHMDMRAAVVGTTAGELTEHLHKLASGATAPSRTRSVRPKLAFLFSGQGTQYVGMGRGLYEHEAVFRQAIAECDAVVAPLLGRPLASLLYGEAASAAELQRTSIAQPALFAFEYALTRLWASWGVEPEYVMGHSLGEYVAAHVAGVFELADALRFVTLRGQLMESLAADGAMVALPMAEEDVETLLRPFAGLVGIAAINGPQQVVVSGAAELVARLCADLAAQGVPAQRVPVAYGFHSQLIDPILDQIEALAAPLRMQPPRRKLVANLTGKLAEGEACSNARYLRDHSRMPVRYFAGLQTLRAEGVETFVEIGPQPVLLGLAASAGLGSECIWLPSIRKTGDDRVQMLKSAARLYQSGRDLDFAGLPGSRDGRLTSAPVYQFDGRRYWATDDERSTLDEGATSDDWHYAVGWKAQHIPSQSARPSSWLLVGQDDALLQPLRAQLEQYGASVAFAHSESSIEYRLRTQGAVDGVIYVPSTAAAAPDADGEQLLDAAVAECMRAAGVVRCLARHAPRARLWIVTRAGQQVEDEDVDVLGGASWSLGRVIGVEHPDMWGGLIDLQPEFRAEDLDLLCRSVLWSDGENQIALRGGHRFVARLRRMHVARSEAAPVLAGDVTYVVTGGVGHVGLHVASFLVRCGARNLVLISRRGLRLSDADGGIAPALRGGAPSVETAAVNDPLRRQRMLQDLRRQGATVRIVELDVCDRERLERLLRQTEPRVAAVFHAAGTNDHQPIVELDEARLRAVLRAKTAGSWELHKLTQDDARAQLVLFSGFVATLATVGRGAYAVANGFLDALACHRRHRGLPAISIGWGLWGGDGGMAVSENALELLPSVGVGAMEPARALSALGRALQAGSGCRVIAEVAWDRFRSFYGLLGRHPILDDLTTPADGSASGSGERAAFLQQLSSMSEGERVQALCARLQSELGRVVVADDLDLDRSFHDFGLDSLAVLQLRSRIQSLLGLTVSPLVVVENPSIRLLAQALSSELASAPGG